ncbi:MAG: histidine phosphatase family protein, partial [Acidimicrobiia bacterium]|nr:histidine phosphatase family protein [Acidimicrobiia bacterium]
MSAPFAHRLLLVRHGQSTWNAEQRWQGQADPPLSSLGERQASAAGAAVQHLALTRIVTSDLVRARRTAELLAPPGTAVTADPALRERHAGDWTGLTRAEIDERYPGWIDDHRSPPGFEGDEPLLERLLPVVEALLTDRDVPAATLAVTHGGVIRTIERHFGAPSTPVPNLGGRWLHVEAGRVDATILLGDREVLV